MLLCTGIRDDDIDDDKNAGDDWRMPNNNVRKNMCPPVKHDHDKNSKNGNSMHEVSVWFFPIKTEENMYREQ